MTRLPAKELFDGTKTPETTTGEFRLAIGNLRQFLFELLGDEGSDKETARLSLGIDLVDVLDRIEVKANSEDLKTVVKAINTVLAGKADKETTDTLSEEIIKKAIPIGSVHFFAMATLPAGYLKADGAAVGRQTYPELFAAIGTTFGSGNGETTFNLPNLIGRVAQGSTTLGQ